jgi:hypothetical protein
MIPQRFTAWLQMTAALSILLLVLCFDPHLPAVGLTQGTLPASLSDREFWEIIERISEPDGFFRSNSGSTDNLLSNETTVSALAAELSQRVKPSGVYLGVGPEQNFSFIAAIRPRMAFITDIRRGNLHLHLMYKALFELSATRADFVARLFTRKRPAGLTDKSTAAQVMAAYLRVPPGGDAAFSSNFAAIVDHLTKTRSLPLGVDDLEGIKYVYQNFYRFGPGITYTSSSGGRSNTPSYADLMSRTDRSGSERTYLASEANFLAVKALEKQNLIVPIVGDFAGPKALRGVGAYLKDKNAVVTAFYVSNVEDYLQNKGSWPMFCENAANLPLDADSAFIRPNGRFALVSIGDETSKCRRN